ncbi:9750_t:CDS:10 [Entrophospora sp. SA101]|nr:9750_t:CDS:10 [Entrophospora sp. SA101]
MDEFIPPENPYGPPVPPCSEMSSQQQRYRSGSISSGSNRTRPQRHVSSGGSGGGYSNLNGGGGSNSNNSGRERRNSFIDRRGIDKNRDRPYREDSYRDRGRDSWNSRQYNNERSRPTHRDTYSQNNIVHDNWSTIIPTSTATATNTTEGGGSGPHHLPPISSSSSHPPPPGLSNQLGPPGVATTGQNGLSSSHLAQGQSSHIGGSAGAITGGNLNQQYQHHYQSHQQHHNENQQQHHHNQHHEQQEYEQQHHHQYQYQHHHQQHHHNQATQLTQSGAHTMYSNYGEMPSYQESISYQGQSNPQMTSSWDQNQISYHQHQQHSQHQNLHPQHQNLQNPQHHQPTHHQYQQQPSHQQHHHPQHYPEQQNYYIKVYKAKNRETGEIVALKRIRMKSEKEGFPITALREVKLLQSLNHGQIVKLNEIMVFKGVVYMVFEYMDHDLTGILGNVQVNFEHQHIKCLMKQLLEGLAYLHENGVLHRDIKGSNILLNNRGELKLADFGLARQFHPKRMHDYTNRVITLWYRPPELCLGATQYGPEVDLWSAGCIMMELITKKAIFPGNDEISQLEYIYKLMGTPTVDDWPSLIDLPWHGILQFSDYKPMFRETYGNYLTPAALELVEVLLSLNPSKRPTARKALEFSYFTEEEPFACSPSE